MQMFSIRLSSGDIVHFGVKGQQWGVKNGPPYPIQDNKKESVINDIKTVIKSLNKEDYKDFSTEKIRHYKIEYEKKTNQLLSLMTGNIVLGLE